MPVTLTVACVQNRATLDVGASVGECEALATKAREAGAELICLPEYCACLDVSEAGGLRIDAHPENAHPALARLVALARALGAWLLVGSVAVGAGGRRARNRSLLLSADGEIVARYDKLHLFDVALSAAEQYRESDHLAPGERAVVATTPWGGLGMTICYDLRFAYLYRALAQAGARLISVPAAFTRTTGHAHWHVLLRARAIETGCYVLAPGQYGAHGEAATYGHSLIVDPWGEVVADAGDGPGFALAKIDLARVDEARRRIPALTHDRVVVVE